jgi:hypothetical protein
MHLSTARLWQQMVLFRIWRGQVLYTLKPNGSIQNLMGLSTKKIVSRNMTSFLLLNHERVRYHNGLLKPNGDSWWDHLANDSINHLLSASTLSLQKLDDSLAKEPTRPHATCNLGARQQRQIADLQSIVKDNYKHLSANHQRSCCSFFI